MRYAPLAVFLIVYLLTCAAAAALLLVDYRPFAGLVEYFSGFRAPSRPDLLPLQVTLLFIAPLLMCLGYLVGLRIAPPRLASGALDLIREARNVPSWLPEPLFYLLAVVALLSLTVFGSQIDIRTWLDPQAWIDARYRTFRDLGFAAFVNVYTLMPLAAAFVVVAASRRGLVSEVRRWLPLVVAISVSLLLFQKRPALNTVILVFSAAAIVLQRTNPRLARRAVAAGVAALTLVYLSFVMIPAYFETRVQLAEPAASAPSSNPAASPNAEYPVTPEIGAQPPATAAPAAITGGGKTQSVLLYALLGPLNRTSVSALYYPVVFPDIHPFYGLDVGQDMLGKLPWFRVGRMPDDNIVVWDYMAPAMPGGRVAAPFQFVLYSQVGLAGALVGSVVVGTLLALAWRCVQDRRVPTVWASLAGALVLLLAVFLAMDSARNSVLVSYGVFWGFLFISAAMTAVAIIDRLEPNHDELSSRS